MTALLRSGDAESILSCFILAQVSMEQSYGHVLLVSYGHVIISMGNCCRTPLRHADSVWGPARWAGEVLARELRLWHSSPSLRFVPSAARRPTARSGDKVRPCSSGDGMPSCPWIFTRCCSQAGEIWGVQASA